MATAIHQYEDKLLDFAYGELPAPEASAVESHVKSCPRCTQALEQIRGVRTTMAALPQVAPPDAGLESLLAYAEQAAKRSAAVPRATAPWWKRMVAPLAGACALALVAVVAWRSQEEGIAPTKEAAALDATRQREAPPPPASVAAAAPEVQGLEQRADAFKGGKAAGGAQAAAENEREKKENKNWDSLSKTTNALGATKAPEEDRQAAQQKDLGESMKVATKESSGKRAYNQKQADFAGANDEGYAPADAKKSGEKLGRLEAKPKPEPKPATKADWANSRGGYVADKAPQEKAEAPAEEQPQAIAAKEPRRAAEVPFGISPGNAASTGGGGVGTAAPSAAPPAPPQKQVAANTPVPAQTESSAPSLAVGLSSGPRGSSAPSKKSMRSNSLGSGDDSFDKSYGADTERKAEVAQRDREVEAKSLLDGARAASNAGNPQEEVRLSLAVVQSNVKGNVRAEALQRLCAALEALGNEDAADKYCDLLLREYPNSAFAKQVADRRNRVQRMPAPKAASKPSSDEYAKEKAAEPSGTSPTKAKKAQEQPAVDAY